MPRLVATGYSLVVCVVSKEEYELIVEDARERECGGSRF